MTSRLAVTPIAALVLILAFTGCAKKAAMAPPQAAAVPAANPAPLPVPEPSVTEPTSTDPAPAAPVASTSQSAEFQPAFFEYDSYTLSDRARAALDADARALRANSNLSVVIEGHCDERGTIEYNQSLGERRADVARDYLVASGVNPSRLHVVSYGKERPSLTSGQAAASSNSNGRFPALSAPGTFRYCSTKPASLPLRNSLEPRPRRLRHPCTSATRMSSFRMRSSAMK